MTYSFFYSRGTAGYVRGEQMADALGGKKNPKSGFESDICIYVKILPPDNPPKNTYYDVDDAPRGVKYLKDHPKMGVIATSSSSYEFLSKALKRKDVVIIPHAHCNYENWRRPNRKVKTVGVIGSITSFQADVDNFSEKLKEIGLEFSYEKEYWENYQYNRKKVCDFHKQIDIQVCWRPKMFAIALKNPNKLANAGSFGIPTIAYSELGFKGWEGAYIEVESIDEMVYMCRELKEKSGVYQFYSDGASYKAESNHISNVLKLYKDL